MEDTAADYKALYEESLLTISEKDGQIAGLQFELEKFRRYFFGKKSEKLPASAAGAGAL